MPDNTNSRAHNAVGMIAAVLIILGSIGSIIYAALTRGM